MTTGVVGSAAELLVYGTAVPLLGEILTRPSLKGTRRRLNEFVKDPDFQRVNYQLFKKLTVDV